MPVEEAKRVTASFSGSAFVPPPRTIHDITAILDQQPRADPAAAERAQARAEATPPATDDAQILRRFYYNRGVAAEDIGRMRQAIADLTRAAEYAPASRNPLQYAIYDELRFTHTRGGDSAKALDYARRAAAAVPRDIGDVIVMHVWLSDQLLNTGDVKASENALDLASQYYWQMTRSNDASRYHARRRAVFLMGQAHAATARGEPAKAERLYREVITLYSGEPMWANHPDLDRARARLGDSLVAQGRLLEAENEARAALLAALRRGGRYSAETAEILGSLVDVMREQGRSEDAERLARARIDILEKIGSVPESRQLIGARLQLAAALNGASRPTEALAEFEAVDRALAGDPVRHERVLGHNATYALVLWATGHTERAVTVATAALTWRQQRLGEGRLETAVAHAVLARALAAEGERAEALRHFRASAPVLIAPRHDDEESTTRTFADSRLDRIVSEYIGLLADIRGTELGRGVDVPAEAFQLAEAARGRGVQAALDAATSRLAAQNPALGDLVRQEQDARKRLAAQYGMLSNALSQPQTQQDAQLITELRAQIDSLGRAADALTLQTRRQFPAYDELVNPRPATLEQARALLGPRDAWLVTYVTPDRTYVWAIPQQGSVAFAVVPIGRDALAGKVAALRRALDSDAHTLGAVPPFDTGLAFELYATLLQPVAAGWRNAENLLVVPHGPLAQLPFTALVTEPVTPGADTAGLFSGYAAVPWLVRSHTITVLPSATALVALRKLARDTSSRRPFIGFGDPWFSDEQARRAAGQAPAPVAPGGVELRAGTRALATADSASLAALPRLPDTADEIRAIASVLGADSARDVFLGDRANEEAVKHADLARYRIVAFATHGLVPGDLDGLTQPALALTAPDVAKIDGDGLLTMEEILGLQLNADWVVLSACNTASGDGAGAEAISGLGRAFFYAGARAVLVTSWPVETTSARALTTDLFRRQADAPGLSRARALQQTMKALIAGGGFVDPITKQRVFSYAHPLFWAPFMLVGDGG